MQKTISFCYPSQVIGGAETLFARVINCLCNINAFKIRLYDYKDGTVRKLLSEMKVFNYDFVEILPNGSKIFNLGWEFFVIADMDALHIVSLLNNFNEVKIVCWDILYTYWHNKLIPGLFGLKTLLAYLEKKRLARILIKMNALMFLEKEGQEILTTFTGIRIPDNMIVRIPIAVTSFKQRCVSEGIVRIGYIGRAVAWKITPVVKLLEDLNSLSGKFHLFIITDDVNSFSRGISSVHLNNHLTIEINPSLTGPELENFLTNNTDVGFGMGTAALEFGRLAIPTILSDFSRLSFPKDYKYQWLHENSGLSLGRDLTMSQCNGKRSLYEIIKELLNDPGSLSKQTLTYVSEYHETGGICKKVIFHAVNSKFCPRHMPFFTMLHYFKTLIKTKLFGQRPIVRNPV